MNLLWVRAHTIIFNFLLGIIFLLFLGACQATPTPSATPTGTDSPTPSPSETPTRHPLPTQRPSPTYSPTPAPSITPGPSPTGTLLPPLSAHEWKPSPILLQAGYHEKDNLTPFGKSPFLILYADGQLITKQCQGSACSYGALQLNLSGICSILNTIDRQGFFDYDPVTFHTPQEGGRSFFIDVNAWRSKAVEIDELDQWLQDPSWLDNTLHCAQCVERPMILPALANTFNFLTRYQPKGVRAYQPDRLALWLSPPWLNGQSSPWLLPDIPLSQLNSASSCSDPKSSQAVEVSGADAVKVSEFINQVISSGYPPIFTEGSLKLQVVDQWLLPEESGASCGETTDQLPAASVPTPDFSLRCQPSDGVIPISTSTPLPPLR